MRWLGLLPAWLTLTALASPALPIVGKIIILIVVLASAWDPSEGLLLVTGLAPLGALLATVFDLGPFRLTEALVLAFLAGWLLRGPLGAGRDFGLTDQEMPAPPPYALRAAWLLAAAIAASAAGLVWQFARASAPLGPGLSALTTNYFLTGDAFGVVEGAKALEGLALFAATLALLRRRPALAVQIPAALVAGAACATIASVLLWSGIGPPAILDRYAKVGYRVAAHLSDVNAAGSYFVLILGLSLGMSLRDRGVARALWLAGAAAAAAGLWLSFSRTALASAGIVIPLAIVWVLTPRWRPAARALAMLVVLATLGGAGLLRVQQLDRNPDYRGAGFRRQFTETSLRIIAARPVFGIGIGRYFPDSELFMGPELAFTYGRENAHNNFLQIAAEIGLFGFGLFAVFVGGSLATAVRALAHAPRDWRLLGGFVGVLAFLGTCLAGHPLLVAEVGAPFWTSFGLLVGLASSTLLNAPLARPRGTIRASVGPRLAAGTVALAIVASVPIVAGARPLARPAGHDVDGLFDWQIGGDGLATAWTKHVASLFTPPDATFIQIPVRAQVEPGARNAKSVEVSVGGVYRGEFSVTDRWMMIPLALPESRIASGVKRVNVRVGRGWQEAAAGAGDYRAGIEVGAPRLITR